MKKILALCLTCFLAITLFACGQKAAAPAEAAKGGAVSFTAGEYEGTGKGYNGDVTVKVSVSDTNITDIQVVASKETEHVGDVSFNILKEDIIACNGVGVDTVSGATFSSMAYVNAVKDALSKANCSDMATVEKAKVNHTPGEKITGEYDVIVVGAGGAGMSAAAQATQDGNSVLVIEKNAEIGGNTLVSGGQYQSAISYLVWDPKNPDAMTGVGFDGKTYDKVKAVQGNINELKTILNWNEDEFDEDYYKTHEFVAGDTEELSKHGVHADYLPVLKDLKKEIQAYLDFAEPKIKAGTAEAGLPLFSTLNLHIFQTYFGGLRQSADKSEWIYGDIDLVRQFIEGGQDVKPWLQAQGSIFNETQPTLIGALWWRENEVPGSDVDLDGDGQKEHYAGNWGAYFAPTYATFKKGANNKILTRTTATDLIMTDGKVTGVKAKMYDGTEVEVTAKKGVVLSTGGYAANITEVLKTNTYWSSEYLTRYTKTTNRNSQVGDGIKMGEKVNAATTGMGYTQLMPISWIDNGNLAFGGGDYAVFINPTTGKRFVDENSERDVLSLEEFKNGIERNGAKGVFIEIANYNHRIPGPYLYTDEDVKERQWVRTIGELADLFKELGLNTNADDVINTLREYDQAILNGEQPKDAPKRACIDLIGDVKKDANGGWDKSTYDLDNARLRVRLMAPSTHHTMGGLKVDTDRRVLDKDGNAIKGLYAAGEVTGGIHGGNRLGGNAIVEIIVSGRTAAKAINADN